MDPLTPTEVKALKNEAKALKKQKGWSQSVVLDHLAAKHGYRNWSLLQKHAQKQEDPTRPAQAIRKERLRDNLKLITLPTIRCEVDETAYLVYRCPECREVHTHEATMNTFGSGDGIDFPPCRKTQSLVVFELRETLDPISVGSLPQEVMQHYTPMGGDESAIDWFTSTHDRAVDSSPLSKESSSGFLWPTYDGVYDIHTVLCEHFPELDEEHMFTLAEDLDMEGPWVTADFMRAQDIDDLLEGEKQMLIENNEGMKATEEVIPNCASGGCQDKAHPDWFPYCEHCGPELMPSALNGDWDDLIDYNSDPNRNF